jgi:hypothetical protein
MIYEMRTYTLKVGAVAAYERAFEEALKVRQKYSKLGAFWHTEIGTLNRVIHMWAYDSLQQRADIRAASVKDESGLWPPRAAELILSQEVEILETLPNVKPWGEPQQWGGLYEMRIYTYTGADFPAAAARFNEKLPGRDGVYPVAGIFQTVQGHLNRLYQIYPYKSWDHREEVRAAAREAGVWPPNAEVRPTEQFVQFMYPASFSPLQ